MPLPDDLWIEWHPTAAWNAEISDGAWTRINLPLRRLHYRRGYRRGQQRVEAGEFSCLFGDPGRTMDPTRSSSPNYRKGRRQFRARARIGSTTLTIFRGLTAGWRPAWTFGDFTVEMVGTDRSPVLEGVFIPSVFEQVAASMAPLWWFKMGEGGGDKLYNVGSQAFDATLTGHSGGSVRNAQLGQQKTLPYTSTSSATFSGTGSAQFGSGTDLGDNFTVAAAFVAAPGQHGFLYSQTLFGATNLGDIAIGLTTGGTDAWSAVAVDDPSAPAVEIQSDQIANDNAPHFISGSYGGSVLRFKHDLETTKVGPLLAPPIPSPRKGKNVVGNSCDAAHPFEGRMNHLLAWNRVISEGERSALHAAALKPWDGLRSDEVVAKVLDYVGIAASERALEAGTVTMGPSRCDASALVCCQRPADTEVGIFFFDREGKARFYRRNSIVPAARTDRDTNPLGTGRVPLRELRFDMDERTFFTVGKAQVATPEPTEVVFRHANAATEGDLVWAPETEYRTAADALAGATFAVGSGQAVHHVTDAVTIGNAPHWIDLLSTDVWDKFNVIYHPGSDDIMAVKVLEVEHEMDGVALTWTTRMSLESL